MESAYSPSLVLIYNKSSLDDEMDVELCTKQFFENVENEALLQLYSSITCICLPHFEQMKKVKGHGKTLYVDGEEIYNLQINKLKQIINQKLEMRIHKKEENGFLCSEKVWTTLFKFVSVFLPLNFLINNFLIIFYTRKKKD